MNLGERLLELRKKKGLSQEEMAEKINVSRQTISKWETGLSTPEFDKIEPLSKLFEISVDELVTGKKIENEKKEENITEHSTKSILLLIGSIFLYFLAIITVIVLDEIAMPDYIVASSFLFLCAVATCMIIFRALTCKKEKKVEKVTIVANQKYKIVEKLISLITLIIYLLISFITYDWYITWIIWIIYALIMEIVKLIFITKGFDEGDDNNE